MTTITENLKGLMTPRELEQKGILSQATQWKRRKDGTLKFYRIGNKIFYHPVEHIDEYFKQNEGNAADAA